MKKIVAGSLCAWLMLCAVTPVMAESTPADVSSAAVEEAGAASELTAEAQALKALKGTWYNELGSYVKITKIRGTRIEGVYNSAVGNAKDEYPLVGFIDPTPVVYNNNTVKSHPISFTVLWQNESKGDSNSVTTWSGQYQIDEQGHAAIRTRWLLTRATDVKSEWSSTYTGTNVFQKTNPLEKNK